MVVSEVNAGAFGMAYITCCLGRSELSICSKLHRWSKALMRSIVKLEDKLPNKSDGKNLPQVAEYNTPREMDVIELPQL
jgi:hypothetical protein